MQKQRKQSGRYKTSSVVGAVLLAGALLESGNAAIAAPAAPPSFSQCRACHAVSPSAKHGLGPNLFGILNRRAGSQAGFLYSPAMKASGVVWTRQNLLKLTQSPQLAVRGTRMAFGGVNDSVKAQEIVDYLTKIQ